MIIISVEQGSVAWREARSGRVTSSRVSDVMAKTKSGYGASRANYHSELVCERLTGQPYDNSFTSTAMEWGKLQEPAARSMYELVKDVDVQCVGLVQHAKISDFLASPDGLVGDDGLVEIKCPNTSTMIDYLTSQTIPQKYLIQMASQMICTGRSWCDFCAFDPRLPNDMQIWIRRVHATDKDVASLIEQINSEVPKFLSEVEETVLRLQNTYSKTGDTNERRTSHNTARHTNKDTSGARLVPSDVERVI